MSFKKTAKVLASKPRSHYTVESIAKELTTSFEINKSQALIETKPNKPNSVLEIRVLFNIDNNNEIQVSHALSQLI